MATKNTILGTVPKSRGRYTEGDTTTKWYYDNILEYKGSSFRCISEESTGITGAPATYNSSTHTLVPNTGWEFFVDTTGALDVEERLAENEEKLSELETKVIYDVTANNNGMTFASLSALLLSDNLSTLIPVSVRCGGMNIRFIQTSDNKYVQYFLTKNVWSASNADWEKINLEEEVIQLSRKVSALPYVPEELFSQNYNNIVCNKFIKYEDNQLKEIEYDGISFIKIAIPSGAKTLFISASENYFPVSYGCIFVDINNTYILSGVWNSQLVDTSAIMPENIPNGAAFVYINYFINKSSSIKIYCGLSFIEKDNLIIPGEISELADFELFDKNNILNKINGFINYGLVFVARNSLYMSSPVRCYSGDIFKISGWCGVDYPATAYSRNVLFFNSNGECVGVDTIREEEFEYSIPNNVDYVSFLFEKNSQNNFSFKRIKSGRLNTSVPAIDIIPFDDNNLDVTSLKINKKNYNLRDASLLDVDNDLLKNDTWVLGKYIDTNGSEVSYGTSAYAHISIEDAKLGYILGKIQGWSNTNNVIIFKNGSTVTGYTENSNDGVRYNYYGGYQAFSIPANTTDVYVNITLGSQDNVKLYISSEEKTKSNVLLLDKYLDTNLVSPIECKQAWNREEGYRYYNNVRSCYPIKVQEGEMYKYSGWSTAQFGPTSISSVYVFLDEDWNFVSYSGSGTDDTIITIPNGVEWMILCKIINTIPILTKIKLAENEPRLISDSVLPASSLWNNVKWVALGDSITADAHSVKSYWKESVANALKMTMYNCGIGSTCLGIKGDYYLDNQAMCTDTRLNEVKSYNPSLVTLQGGTNDCAQSIPLGTNNEFAKPLAQKDKQTFKGAMSFIIETLLTWKPSLKLLVLTANFGDGDDGASLSTIGLTFADYAYAMTEVAKYYGIPFVDLHSEQGINAITASYYTSDGIHWNQIGGQVASSLVIQKLKQINNSLL